MTWQIAEEKAIGILLNARQVAVMMATPADLEDMATGFLLAEGYFRDLSAVTSVLVWPTEAGFCVNVTADRHPLRPLPGRALEGRSGCGVCGMSDVTDVTLDVIYKERSPLEASAVASAFDQLARNQPINAANRSVHAAGFATIDGEIVMTREDVGRHNALDKLIGALARSGTDGASGFAVLTSRCSFELVQKTALAGLGGVATLSAPTRLALDIAKKAGLPLASRAPGGVVVF